MARKKTNKLTPVEVALKGVRSSLDRLNEASKKYDQLAPTEDLPKLVYWYMHYKNKLRGLLDEEQRQTWESAKEKYYAGICEKGCLAVLRHLDRRYNHGPSTVKLHYQDGEKALDLLKLVLIIDTHLTSRRKLVVEFEGKAVIGEKMSIHDKVIDFATKYGFKKRMVKDGFIEIDINDAVRKFAFREVQK